MSQLVARPRHERVNPKPSERPKTKKPDEKQRGTAAFLAHPFFTLIATAILSGLLVPLIIGEWQGRNKEVEVKTELVTKMSESTGKFIVYQSTRVLGNLNRKAEEWRRKDSEAFEEFMRNRQVIQARLTAYEIGTSGNRTGVTLAEQWNDYARSVEEFANLYPSTEHDVRSHAREALQTYFINVMPEPATAACEGLGPLGVALPGVPVGGTDTNDKSCMGVAWVKLTGRSDDQGFREAWFDLRRLFLLRNAEMTGMVMTSCTSLRALHFPWDGCE